jgi:hypothetical protein
MATKRLPNRTIDGVEYEVRKVDIRPIDFPGFGVLPVSEEQYRLPGKTLWNSNTEQARKARK